MKLKEAVDTLGGPTAAARVSGIKRTVIHYWLGRGAPAWRAADVARLVDLARLRQGLPKSARKAA